MNIDKSDSTEDRPPTKPVDADEAAGKKESKKKPADPQPLERRANTQAIKDMQKLGERLKKLQEAAHEGDAPPPQPQGYYERGGTVITPSDKPESASGLAGDEEEAAPEPDLEEILPPARKKTDSLDSLRAKLLEKKKKKPH